MPRPKFLRPVDEVNSELENSSNHRLNTMGSGMRSSCGGPRTGSGEGGSSDIQQPYGSTFKQKSSNSRTSNKDAAVNNNNGASMVPQQ